MAKILSITNDSQECDNILTKAIQSGHTSFLLGSGASRPAISIAGTIEVELNKLLEKDEKEYLAKKFEFLAEIQDVTNKLVGEKPDANIQTALGNYEKFLSILGQILDERKTTLLSKQFTIFTSNYDVFVEKAADNAININLNDGFNRNTSLKTEFKFEPDQFFDVTQKTGNLFNYTFSVPSINLIKLHGSLTWKSDGRELVLRRSTSDIPTDEGGKGEGFEKSIQEFSDAFSLILPTRNKFNQTLLERVYYDLLRIYANTLEIENTVLICFGFSFEDEHILEITKRALKNPTLMLIIMAFKKDSAESYQEKFSKFNNVIVFHPDGDDELNFPVLNGLLGNVIAADKHAD